MTVPELPPQDSVSYLWYMQGRHDELADFLKDLNPAVVGLLDDLISYSRGRGSSYATAENVLVGLMDMRCPSKLRRKFRSGF